MRSSKFVLLAVAASCLAVLAAAMYLQLVKDMLPCPLCVLQRYAFLGIGLFALLAAVMPEKNRRVAAGLSFASALAGIGVAGKHLYVLSNPQLSCGIDPLETGLNKIFLSVWWPDFFRADGLCDTPYEPILGLSIPGWAMVWFLICAIATASVMLQRKRSSMFGERR